MGEARDDIKAIFLEALEIESPGELSAYLDRACGRDAKLRARVEALLKSHREVGNFLKTPAIEMEITSDGSPLIEGPGTIIGRYKLLERIGEGGFGVVYMAQQTQPIRRKVALKIIKLGMDTKQVIARFEAERQALAMMDHPNIAKVLDAGATESGRPYFVMELVGGVPITEYCDKHELPTRRRLELFIDVCRALQHAHQKAIIHRDLKPTNVLVAVHDGEPVPKVIDFGIAKALGRPLTEKTVFTEFRQFIGTPEYMSPEQAQPGGLDVDTRCDIYGLGVLLYELLTGATPFEPRQLREAGYEEILRTIRETDPPKPSTRVNTLGETLTEVATHRQVAPDGLERLLRGDLDWIVMKALEKDRTRRYETADALAEDIQRHLDDQPVQAGPPGAGYRIGKFVRRHRTGVAAGLLIAAALVIGLVMATIGFVHATREREIAQRERETARKARDDARAEADRADLVTREFLRTLSSIDPARTRRRDVSMREVLAMTAKQVGRRFKNQPKAEAAVRHRIGNIYRALGLYGVAEEHLRIAVELRRRLLGPQHRHTLVSMNSLGGALEGLGKHRESEKLFREALDFSQRTLGNEHPDTLGSMNNLGVALLGLGKYREAWKLHRETLKIRRRVLGKEHPDTLGSMSHLANALRGQRRHAEAEKLHRETLEIRRRVLGKEHAHTLDSMNNLAGALCGQGRHAEAEKLLRETVEIRRRVLGKDHHDTLESMHNLGVALVGLGKHREAEKLYRETLEICRRVLGKEHPDTLGSMNNLANALHGQGRHAEAEKLHRETLEIRRRVLGKEHPDTLLSMNNLAITLGGQRRHAEEEKLYRETLEIRRRVLGKDHPDTLHTMHWLAVAVAAQCQDEKADEALLQVLDLLAKLVADSPENVALRKELRACALSVNNLAWRLATHADPKQRDPPRAVKLAKKAVEAAPKKWTIWNTLGVAHYRAGQWKAAVAALEKSTGLHGRNSCDLLFLAMAHWQLGNKDQARAQYNRAVAWMERNKPRGSGGPKLLRFRAEAEALLGVTPTSAPAGRKETAPATRPKP